MAEYDYQTKKTILRYNSYWLGRRPEYYVLGTVFHEIRHIIQEGLPYETEEQQIFCELDAEQYAVEMITQFYPKEAKKYITFVRVHEIGNPKWCKKNSIYVKAYMQIPVYQ